MIFLTSLKARSQKVLVSKICVTGLIVFRKFQSGPSELNYSKKDAIYNFHRIFFFRAIDKALKIR